MAFNINSIPIKYKLILSIYAVLFVIITISFSFIIYQEIKNKHNELIVETKIFNQFFSQGFVAIVAFGDVDVATDVTSRLRTLNKIQGLTIYNTKHQAIFFYKQNESQALETLPDGWGGKSQHDFIDDSLLMFDVLSYQDTDYGYILIQVSTKEINQILERQINQAAIILLILLLASFILAWMIQQYFSNPIQQLVQALLNAAEKLDYSVRLPNTRKDEIGDLFRGFNSLQNKIEEEKKALHDQQFAFDQHCIVGITDTKGTITYANDRFVKISGYSKDELIGKNNRILKSSFHDDNFFKDMYQTISAGEIWTGDICNKAKDGYEYWVATTIVPLMGESNKPLSYIAMQTDITVQNKAEANLARAQKMVHIGSWELDLIRNDLHWSAEIYRIFEIDPAKFKATYEAFLDVIHPEDRAKVNEAYKRSLENRLPYEIEHRLLMKDGRVKIVKEQCETFFDETGKALRSIGVVHDISNSKHTEEALRRSQKMDAVGQLTGGIAHDFNNIMGIILGNIELLELLKITDSKILSRIEPIKITAQRAAKLTKQLLAFSRRKAEQLAVTNINNLLASMKSLIEHSVTPEIEVGYQFTENLWLAKIDPGDFQDTILNLVLNSRDAMSNSGNLMIETRNTHLDEKYCAHNPGVAQGDYVEIIVSDDGRGIEPEQLQRIFEPFYTTKAEGSGTGLGLAMVFGFVERSKGHVKVHSEINDGTTFRVYLPRTYSVNEDMEAIKQNVKNDLPQGNETILVVDDEAGLRELAKESLQMLGYKIITASDGNEALKILDETSGIDLLFSDVVMPGGVNGYELAVLTERKYPQIKILLTSGYTNKAVIKNDQSKLEWDRYENDLLRKPYTRKDLASRIRKILG